MWNIELIWKRIAGRKEKQMKSATGKSIDEHFRLLQRPKLVCEVKMEDLQIKNFKLKDRVINACCDNTNYVLRLVDFCEKNKKNILLLTRVAGYHSYLMKNGCSKQEAAKLVLEEYKH